MVRDFHALASGHREALLHAYFYHLKLDKAYRRLGGIKYSSSPSEKIPIS